VFSKLADFFRQNFLILITSISAAFLLGAIFVASGILVAWRWELSDQLASVISLWIMNYILVIVFSAQFFSPLEPTVAALYTFPFTPGDPCARLAQPENEDKTVNLVAPKATGRSIGLFKGCRQVQTLLHSLYCCLL